MNFLIVTIEAGGNVPPVLNLIKSLTSKGHRVCALSEPCMQHLLEGAGAEFVPFTEYFTKTDRKKDIFEDWKAKDNGFKNVIFGPAEIVVNETLAQIRRDRPDVVIGDVVLPAALIAAEAEGVPRVMLFHMPEYLPGGNRPPGGLGLIPGKGPFGKLRDRLVTGIFHLIFNKFKPQFNAIRAKHGLAPYQNITEIFHQADLRIIQTSPAFDIPISPAPANVLYTGPVLDDPDWVEAWQNPWLPTDTRPLVVVSLSTTFQNQKKNIENCIAALASLPVRGLITLGLAMEDENFHAPENVKVIAGASHAQIFPHAAAVVTHAGHGTVMRALAYGKPMVCMPMGRDQGDNAAKVAMHGAGIALSSNASPAKIAKAVQALLKDGKYTKAAQALGEKIKWDAAAGDPVAALERVVQKKKPAEITG